MQVCCLAAWSHTSASSLLYRVRFVPCRCASCTTGTAPVALHCLDATSCQPGNAPWEPTTTRWGGPYCTACAPDHVLTIFYPSSNNSAALPPYGQYLGCLPCSQLGCAEGACDALTGCARCNVGSRLVFQQSSNRTVWTCTEPGSNWPVGPHGA